ncbi:MAG: DNA polymerase III subunit beta [Planctomycetota bacterium]|nr:DNA polymerase III subunit beta [Planctomycetota bacterium]
MKVICDQGVLAEALGVIGGVVARRTPTPVLTCVRLTAQDGRLAMAATDTEASLKLVIDQVEVEKDGELLIPANKLLQIIRACDSPTVTLNGKGHHVQIISAGSNFKLNGYDPAESPEIPDFNSDNIDGTIDGGTLVPLVARSLFAAADEHSRYAINGVLFDRHDKKLRLVATDGRRLAVAAGECTKGSGERRCIVPSKALGLVRQLVRSPDANVSIVVDDHHVTFHVDDASGPSTLTTTLVEGKFPPFEDVIPKDQDKRCTIDREVLRAAIIRAALLTSEESRSVCMKFENEQLTLSSHEPEMGEAVIQLPLADWEGDELEINFNPNLLGDALKVIDTDQVLLEFKSPNKPGVLRTGRDFTYVLVPLNL